MRAQDEPELGSISVAAPPYSTRRVLRNQETLRVLVQLRFNEAADPDKRHASAEYCVNLAPGGGDLPGAAAADAPQADRVSPSEADAPVAETAAPGRPRRRGGKAGKPLAAAVPRGIGRAGLHPAQRTVVQFVTQELKYDLPHVRDVKQSREAAADAEAPGGKRPRK